MARQGAGLIRNSGAIAIQSYDLIVLGGGPAGMNAANTAAVLGQKVALIEKNSRIGGAGINSGTLPSKTLRETAIALSGLNSRDLYGVDLSLRRDVTIADLMYHYRHASERERQRMESILEHLDVDCYVGEAKFKDSHTVVVDHSDGGASELRGDYFLIATGSLPIRPDIFQFEDDRIHDSDELLNLTNLPKKLVVVGAGVIGSEYACTFSALGVEVELVDGRDQLLPFLDHDISIALHADMSKSIHFHFNERVEACDNSDPDLLKLTLTSGATIECDNVLVCAGRYSNTANLGLEAAGISPGRKGIVPVTKRYRSVDVEHIYAAGDVIGPPALAATSMEQARIAVCDAFRAPRKGDMAELIPTGIYTIPEVAAIGATEESLKADGVAYIVGRSGYAQHARGRIIGDETGFLKLLYRADDMKLLGVHVIGEHATELVHTGMVAMLMGADADIFNAACFNYPTLGDLYKYATYNAMLQRMNHDGEKSSRK